MAYGDKYYPAGSAASRPPQGAADGRADAPQAPAPAAPGARVRPSGRPADYGRGSPYGQTMPQRTPYGQSAPQRTPYGQPAPQRPTCAPPAGQPYPARQPYPTRPAASRYPTRSEDPFAAERARMQARQSNYSGGGRTPEYSGSTPTYTEISWDSFQRGLNGGKAPSSAPRRPGPDTGSRTVPPQPGGRSPADPARDRQGGTPQNPARTRTRESVSPQPRGYAPSYTGDRQGTDYHRGAAPRPGAGYPTRSSDEELFAGGYSLPEEPGGLRNTPRRPSVPKWRRIHPIFYAAGAVLLLILVLIGIKIFGGGKNKPEEPYQRPTVSTAVPEHTASDPGENPGSAEPTPESTPAPTPVPTATPSGPKAALADGRIVPADWGVAIPARREAVYDSFFDNSCMIGNSLVDGFRTWSGLTTCRYIYSTGAVVNNVIGVMDLSPITLNEKDYYNNIYLMFGLNEVGSDVNAFVQSYIKLINYLREYHPSANIILVSVTPVTKEVDADPNEVQTMERVRNFNSALRSLCEDQGCWYLDIFSLLVDSEGYLSSDYAYAGDGKHFEKSGYVAWANYMKNHYVDDKLPTE